MQEFINVHCHLWNFKFIPDSFFKTRAPFREWLLRRSFCRWLARVITFLLPGNEYDRLHEVLTIMKKDIKEVATGLIREMREANIVLATPLMMDLESASFKEKPEIPYRYQVKLVSELATEYAGKIMPFIMFDPHRKSASELVKTALEEMGFLGVKMYPPLGYHPDPSSFFNDSEVNHVLDEIYEYCESNSIPITTHCSNCVGATAYSSDLMYCKELVLEFSQPPSWQGVLKKYPKLYLNFAHFGGDKDFLEKNNPKSWANTIQKLMQQYDNVYADISYHCKALANKTSRDYFKTLMKLTNKDIIKNRVIFGTDWPMTRHTWTEHEYVEAFERLPPAILDQIALQNPLGFLFPDKKLPLRIKNFFKSNNIKVATLPSWMKNNLMI